MIDELLQRSIAKSLRESTVPTSSPLPAPSPASKLSQVDHAKIARIMAQAIERRRLSSVATARGGDRAVPMAIATPGPPLSAPQAALNTAPVATTGGATPMIV